jgi:hypothetical protein
MGTVGAIFPLKHLQNGLAAAWDPSGPHLPWLNIGVLAVWGAAAATLAIRRFRWEPAPS